MRIADLDTSRGDDCPSGWSKIANPVAACIAPNDTRGCYSSWFSTLSFSFSKVCGMAVGYQKGTTNGFYSSRSINGPYVDGISITRGTPRNHIWTYGIGLASSNGDFNCPCSRRPPLSLGLPPSFVHNNYYCESGRAFTSTNSAESGVYTGNPVWDGKGCPINNNCCSNPSLPWFYRQISLTGSEDIEIKFVVMKHPPMKMF